MDTKRVRVDGSVPPQTEDKTPKSSSTSTVERYKAHLHAIFDGKKPLPDHIRGLQAGALEDGTHAADSDAADKCNDVPALSPKASISGTPSKTMRRIQQNKGVCYDTLLAGIKQAVSPDEVTNATDAFLAAGFAWPLDEDTLSKVLGHRSEKVLVEALTQLRKYLESSAPKNPRLLKSRIDNVALLANSSELRELCATLRTAL
jgi:hypothetical protein